MTEKKSYASQPGTLPSHAKSQPPKHKLVNKPASPTAQKQETPSC